MSKAPWFDLWKIKVQSPLRIRNNTKIEGFLLLFFSLIMKKTNPKLKSFITLSDFDDRQMQTRGLREKPYIHGLCHIIMQVPFTFDPKAQIIKRQSIVLYWSY